MQCGGVMVLRSDSRLEHAVMPGQQIMQATITASLSTILKQYTPDEKSSLNVHILRHPGSSNHLALILQKPPSHLVRERLPDGASSSTSALSSGRSRRLLSGLINGDSCPASVQVCGVRHWWFNGSRELYLLSVLTLGPSGTEDSSEEVSPVINRNVFSFFARLAFGGSVATGLLESLSSKRESYGSATLE